LNLDNKDETLEIRLENTNRNSQKELGKRSTQKFSSQDSVISIPKVTDAVLDQHLQKVTENSDQEEYRRDQSYVKSPFKGMVHIDSSLLLSEVQYIQDTPNKGGILNQNEAQNNKHIYEQELNRLK